MKRGAMQMETIRVHGRSMAVRRRGERGTPVVLVHGNSCSSRCFERQLSSDLAADFRLIAVDLPGHGDSEPAADPEQVYTLPGYARAVAAAASGLGVEDAVFVGWSLGGHVLLEATEALARARGILVFGAPPISSSADLPRAMSTDPALGAAFREDSTDAEVRALVGRFFRPGYAVPPAFFEDFHRTDKRARATLGASVARNDFRDEVRVARETKRPLAIVHGADDGITHGDYIQGLQLHGLWRGGMQTVPGAGHTPHWENPEAFNRLVHDFVSSCARAG